MSKYLFILAALFIGGFLSIQGSINAQLSSFLKHPLQAALTNFAVGTFVLIMLNILLRTHVPSFNELKSIPWYLFFGGMLGALFVTSVVVLIPRIGVTTMLAASIAGQLIIAALIDHLGLFNVPMHHLSVSRVSGIVLLLVSIILIQK